jgi:hypothetical protein
MRASASNRGRVERLGWPAAGGRSAGISPLPGGSFARVLRTKALRTRRLPRTAPPLPAATGPRHNVPDAAPRELIEAVSLAPDAPIAGRRSRGPGPESHALSGAAPPASSATVTAGQRAQVKSAW